MRAGLEISAVVNYNPKTYAEWVAFEPGGLPVYAASRATVKVPQRYMPIIIR